MEEEGGRRELSVPSHHARRERATPRHRRPGARHSCPVAPPPTASSSLPSCRHQRPKPRDASERGDERKRGDEEGQPPRLVSVAAELQPSPCQVAVAIVEIEERARRERNRMCERSHCQTRGQRSSNLNEGEALAVHSLSDPTQTATDKVGSSGSENAAPMILAYTIKALIAPYFGCTDVSKYPTKL
ncbi:uncharacterized protein LOC130965891 [Arachis stenosperma]|uniref:uncharacterized protein LOC130965891 n=1 Tax=Arachis stenosperma TaxID=217475 RepID=UPI0025AB721A|nr:uncharacterized protein LOC130965891 [Arachis stenosperma]